MSNATPGPWKAHFEEAYFVTGPDLGRVAMMMNLKGAHGLGGRRSGAESAANCRLIAAAPALLSALETLHERLMKCSRDPISAAEAYDSFYQNDVLSAIAAAKGES